MSLYGNSTEVGFITNNGRRFVPDKSLTIQNNAKVVTAKFGDGYEQRARKGINSLVNAYSLTFTNRSVEDSYEICRFFDEVLGVNAFDFTLPSERANLYSTVSVVCDDYNKTLDYNNYYSINATFRRVYS